MGMRSTVRPYYTRILKGSRTCVYCGEFAEETDHVLPVSYAFGLLSADPGLLKRYKRALYIVPSCRSCNSIAGDDVGFSGIKEKRRYIRAKLEEKHKKVLAQVDWAEDDVEELGPTLKSHVEHMQDKKAKLRRRLGKLKK